uniref:Uncharacterized protein n=1 Tax=Timema cristinae TaxID=61476 RepID=A0A7R9CFH1_TIMCR|nr:unnamed protein product [Timema cristinae]
MKDLIQEFQHNFRSQGVLPLIGFLLKQQMKDLIPESHKKVRTPEGQKMLTFSPVPDVVDLARFSERSSSKEIWTSRRLDAERRMKDEKTRRLLQVEPLLFRRGTSKEDVAAGPGRSGALGPLTYFGQNCSDFAIVEQEGLGNGYAKYSSDAEVDDVDEERQKTERANPGLGGNKEGKKENKQRNESTEPQHTNEFVEDRAPGWKEVIKCLKEATREAAGIADILVIRDNEGKSYADILQKVNQDVSEENIGDSIQNIRRTNTGQLLIVLNKKSGARTDELWRLMADALKEDEEVLRKVVKVDLEIRDIKDTSTKRGVADVLQKTAGESCVIAAEAVYSLRRAYGETQRTSMFDLNLFCAALDDGPIREGSTTQRVEEAMRRVTKGCDATMPRKRSPNQRPPILVSSTVYFNYDKSVAHSHFDCPCYLIQEHSEVLQMLQPDNVLPTKIPGLITSHRIDWERYTTQLEESKTVVEINGVDKKLYLLFVLKIYILDKHLERLKSFRYAVTNVRHASAILCWWTSRNYAETLAASTGQTHLSFSQKLPSITKYSTSYNSCKLYNVYSGYTYSGYTVDESSNPGF